MVGSIASFARVLDGDFFFLCGRSGVKTYSNDFERGGPPIFFGAVVKIRNSNSLVNMSTDGIFLQCFVF